MEITYRRSLHKSYMCIETTEDVVEEHELMILQKYSAPQLLPMQLMIQDGRVQYWFEITGKQQMADYIGGKQIGMEQLKMALFSVEQMCRKLPEFLLREERISLLPELLYVDFTDETLYFTYLPFQNGNFLKEFRRWMEEVLRNLDHQDRKCVELAYSVYEKSREENISIQELLKEMQIEEVQTEEVGEEGIHCSEELSKEVQVERMHTEKIGTEKVQVQETKKESDGEKRTQSVRKIWEKVTASWKSFEKGDRTSRTEELKSRLLQEPVKWKNWFQQEFLQKRERYRKEKVHYTPQKYQKQEEAYKPQEQPKQEETYRPQEQPGQKESWKPQKQPKQETDFNQSIFHNQENGQTQLLRTQRGEAEGKLIYQGKNECSDFRIETQEFLIGRNSWQVNGKIETDGISRMHARIVKRGEEYYIEDLNSTNGTYVNGELLEYHVPRKLAPNDWIRFGNEEYLFF